MCWDTVFFPRLFAGQQYQNATAVVDHTDTGLACRFTGQCVFGSGLHPDVFDSRADGVRAVDGAFAHTDHFAVSDNRVDIVLDNGATSSLWWATKNEWLGLIDVAGFEVEALYGDFDRSPIEDNSSEYVFVVRHTASRRNP